MNKTVVSLLARRSVLCLLLLLFTAAPSSVFAQRGNQSEEDSKPEWLQFGGTRPYPSERIIIPHWRLADGPNVRAAFRAVIAPTRKSTVRVRTDGIDTALGGIVGEEGWIITKASRLPGAITCLLPDRREVKARIVGIDRDYDLALLKVDAGKLPALKLESTLNLEPALNLEKVASPAIGAWLATVGTKRGPQSVGVLSVEAREIRHRAGTLGVRFDDHSDQPLIVRVFPNTGAEAAGLLNDDVLISVDSLPTPTRRLFIDKVREHSPGDWLKLGVRRGDETLQVNALLQGKMPWRLPTRDEFQNGLGSPLSQRRLGFPSAFQHDTVLKPSDCGGPVVDLDGKVVGFNLARAGRTETYAIPTDVVIKVIEKLKAKELSKSTRKVDGFAGYKLGVF